MGRSNSRFEFSFPDRSPMHSSTRRTNYSLVIAVDINYSCHRPVVSWNVVLIYNNNIPNFEVPSLALVTGDNGCRLFGSLRTSTVRGLESKMPSISVIRVNKDSSSRNSVCVFQNHPRMALAERICRSQTPPIWLAKAGFLCHLIQSPPCSSRKDWIFLSSISIYAFFNSRSALMKLLPLSE